jgi:Flp pilus assembly protein TadG
MLTSPRDTGPKPGTDAGGVARQRRDERGVVTVLVVVLLPALLVLVGFGYDGGQMLAAKVQASNEAAEAARAGAGQLAAQSRGATTATLDPAAAVAAADNYLAAVGHQGQVTVNGTVVTVTVSFDRPLVFFGAIGPSSAHVVETASADATAGISTAGG